MSLLTTQIKSVLFLSLAIINTTLAIPAQGQTTMICQQTSEQEIAALFERWNNSLATLDPDQVVANYASAAVLLATVSNTPRTNHSEIREYFVDFLKNKPQGVIDFSVINIGCNTASDTGIYTFTLYNEQGEATQVPARYSYVYKYINGEWLIEHHHSSLMPESTTDKE